MRTRSMIRDSLNTVSFISVSEDSLHSKQHVSLRSSRLVRIGSNSSFEFCTTVAPFRTAMATGSLQCIGSLHNCLSYGQKTKRNMPCQRSEENACEANKTYGVVLRCFAGPKCQLAPKETETQFPKLWQMNNWMSITHFKWSRFSQAIPKEMNLCFARCLSRCGHVLFYNKMVTSKAMPPKAKPKIGTRHPEMQRSSCATRL